MASHRFTSASAMRQALRLNVPKTIREKAGRVYFDAVTELHEVLVESTPVDKGYLRASLLASTSESLPPTIEPRDNHAAAGAYLAQANKSAAMVGAALVGAARGFLPITMGYLASYAPYVEDKVHMVKQARARWRIIARGAVARARMDV